MNFSHDRPPHKTVLLSFRFLTVSVIGSLSMAIASVYADLPQLVALLGSLVSILAGLILEAIHQAFGETVNVASLFAASGALHDADENNEASARIRHENVDLLADIANAAGWNPLQLHKCFRSGILLAESERLHDTPASALRSRLQRNGIAATAYENGLIRLSAPKSRVTDQQVDILSHAFRNL